MLSIFFFFFFFQAEDGIRDKTVCVEFRRVLFRSLVAAGEGWFVLNAREARWRHREGRGDSLPFEGATDFPQVGINLFVLGPGEPIGMYHWEADQEDFLLLSGEALLLVEGQERPLRPWDFVHCPPKTNHMIVGAGAGPCVVLAVGA